MLIAAWNVPEGEATLPALFQRAAQAQPSRTALRSRHAQLTYGELDAVSNRVAHALIARGGSIGDRVALLMLHDLPQIVALLAALKAGRIVVALNPTHPAERLRVLIDDAEPVAIVTDHANETLANEVAGNKTCVVRYEDCVEHARSHEPAVAIPPEQGAALIYTSGSTGGPKAIIQTHRQLANNVALHTEAMGYRPDDRIPLFASISGGQGLTTAYCALLNGASLCPFPVAVAGLAGLADWIDELGITVYSSSASIFRNFMRTIDAGHVFRGIRAVRLSSESATSDDFKLFQQHFRDDCIFVHTLSSSETANIAWSRRRRHEQVPEGRLPVGLPSRGDAVMLLDEAGQPVARGEIGEIAVKSRFVAAGYWRNEALTAERFGPDLDGSGTRLVRTGDLGRINSEGLLEFVGRQDDRVKIRGNRIALSEIEAALHRLEGVQRATVEAIARPQAEPLLVAFVTQDAGHTWSSAALRNSLRATLPDHMVPSRLMVLDAFPLTPSGKIDRNALRRTDFAQSAAHPSDQPQSEMERFLAQLWRESFNTAQIGRHDNFFELGGDSLIAAVMAARLHAAFQVEPELATFFDFPDLSELATEIERLRRSAAASATDRTVASRPADVPLTFSQEVFWKQSQSSPASMTMSRCCRITGPLDVTAFRRSIDILVERHEMLRTTFSRSGDRIVQTLHPAGPAALTFHDLTGTADAEKEARRIWRAEQTHIFDLSTLPLARFALIRLRSEEYRLVYAVHSILVDGWAWNVFFDELAQIYQRHVQGHATSDPALPAPRQYSDYAIWQRDALRPDGERCRQVLRWWANDILAASYRTAPRYRSAMSWCMDRMPSLPRPLKQGIGALVRAATRPPLPPRSELPLKRAAPVDRVELEDQIIDWGLPPDVSARLGTIGRQEGTSYYVTRLAAYIAMLAVETGDPDVVLYVPLSNRNRPETRDVFGYCATLAILIVRCDGRQSFRELLNQVRDRLRTLQLHADLPYERIHRDMRAWKIKMPQGRAFLSNAWAHAPIRCGGVEIAFMPDRFANAAPLVFEVRLDASNEETGCGVIFDARHYDPLKVRAFVNRFAALLDFVSHAPDTPLSDAFSSITRP